MFGILSVWLATIALMISIAMVVYRPAFNDVLLLVNLYFLCPLSFTFAGMVLWVTRKEPETNEILRLQVKVAIGIGLVAAAIIYVLVHFAERLPSS